MTRGGGCTALCSLEEFAATGGCAGREHHQVQKGIRRTHGDVLNKTASDVSSYRPKPTMPGRVREGPGRSRRALHTCPPRSTSCAPRLQPGSWTRSTAGPSQRSHAYAFMSQLPPWAPNSLGVGSGESITWQKTKHASDYSPGAAWSEPCRSS